MLTSDDIEYAIENTKILLAPEKRIATFGTTAFRFYVITELLDGVNQIRVRDGMLHAERPQILSPQAFRKLLLEGFDEMDEDFVSTLQRRMGKLSFLKYGFNIRKTDVTETVVHDSLEQVIARVRDSVPQGEESRCAILQGVDDAWEICLLQFTLGMVQESLGGNLDDFRGRGLL